MQNKTLLAGIAAAIIILLGAGGIFLYTKNKSNPTPNSTVAKVSPTPKENNSSGSLKDIFTNSGNKVCTFDVNSEEGKTKGTIYNSGTKSYGEIQITSDKKTQKTFFIRNNDTFYMWGDAFSTGLKMTLSVDEMASKLSSAQPTTTPSQKINFKCNNWTVDSSKFTPPTNVKFTDMTSFVNPTGVTGSPTSGNKTTTPDECSICSSLSGSAQSACLAQFNCK